MSQGRSRTFDLVVHRQTNKSMDVSITIEGDYSEPAARQMAEDQALEQAKNTDFNDIGGESVHYEVENQ